MPSRKRKQPACAVASLSSKPCAGEITEVILVSAAVPLPGGIPDRVRLCQWHHQMELMVWGVKKFFSVYDLAALSEITDDAAAPWREELETLPDDSRLFFSLPGELEFRLNRLAEEGGDGEGHPRPEFEYLKDVPIDLGEICLTDKQLMAVCMVFYGGVKKKRAAQAMNITSQALSDHIKAALKKIADTLARI